MLTEVGVTEKKTHSSSLEEHEAEKVRPTSAGSAKAAACQVRPCCAAEPEEIKTKIDLSHISKPGDVLKAITKQQAPARRQLRPRPSPRSYAKPAASSAASEPATPVAAKPPAATAVLRQRRASASRRHRHAG